MQTSGFSYQFYKTTTEAWDAMYQAIELAQKSIYWEIYILVDDSVGKRFVDALVKKALAGVEVKIIIDAFGSSSFSNAAEKSCAMAGIEVLKYSPTGLSWKFWNMIRRLLRRNHRKVLIIDEEVVFLGGVNVKAEYQTWDDIFVKITGKVARPLLRGFAKSYVASGGKRRNVKHMLHPKLEEVIPEWRNKLKFILHSPSTANIPNSKRLFLKALAVAKETVNLLTPYYVPDKHFLRAIEMARKRGVKVNIFLPLRPDVRLMELIGRTYYELTTNAGADIYLLPEMHHGKAMTVDKKMGMVGSINMTPRSFSHQEESAVSFTEEQMVDELNVLFNDLKTKAQPLDIEKWRRRKRVHRFREWLAKKLEYWV